VTKEEAAPTVRPMTRFQRAATRRPPAARIAILYLAEARDLIGECVRLPPDQRLLLAGS